MTAANGLRAPRTPSTPRRAPDTAARKRAKRSGRETGCWTYIDGEQLQRAGFEPGGDVPYYLVTGAPHSKNTGRAIVNLYRAP